MVIVSVVSAVKQQNVGRSKCVTQRRCHRLLSWKLYLFECVMPPPPSDSSHPLARALINCARPLIARSAQVFCLVDFPDKIYYIIIN